MKPEIQIIWTDALRSGKYKQGTKQLRSADNEFCCLGVLCDLHRQHTGGPEWMFDVAVGRTCYLRNSMFLPKEVMDWSGLKSVSGLYMLNDVSYELTHDNDNGKTFEEIADIIEANF